MQQHHAACPHAAAAVSPQGPGDFGQFGMSGLRGEIDEGALECRVGSVARIAPELAWLLFGLLVGRRQQSAVMSAGERLPMEIEGSRETGFARTLAATVLVH